MKAFLFTLSILLGSFSLRGQTPFFKLPEPKGTIRVAVVPLGDVPAADVYLVKKALEDYYLAAVTVTEPLALPASARVNGRSKSIRIKNGRKLVVTDSTNLKTLPGDLLRYQGEFDKVVGVTRYGITQEGNWSIRGLTAKFDRGTYCLISTYLVGQQSATPEEYAFRLAKVALHEFGHYLGLPHCGQDAASSMEYSDKVSTVPVGDPRCFMLQSTPDGLQHYATTNQLCDQCRAKIKNHLKQLSYSAK